MRAEIALAVISGFTVFVASAEDARAFCRTSTCRAPPDYPTGTACYPANFAQVCASMNPPAKALPIWWHNACVSYDIQKDASRQVPYATAANVIGKAFSKWTATTCPGGSSRVSISVHDLGPVSCDLVQYSSDQGNQHVIIFHDDSWPHNDANNTLGLTTITFDADTGEIYDADMEINATMPLAVGDPVPPGGYDFESIVTHETGHFLGLAHSGDAQATMFAHYTPGSITMRTLTSDDTAGICSIYPPDGTRSIDVSVTASGRVLEGPCDPTPRHGFQSQCAQPANRGCMSAPSEDGAPAPHPVILAVAAVAGGAARRARRGRSARA
jgi:hypothetical protein